MSFPFYKQLNAVDCGPACLRMITRFYGRHYNNETLRQWTGFSKQGVSLFGISEAAEKIGLKTRCVRINFSQLNEVGLPCILHWHQNHFVVLYKITANEVKIADPAKGLISFKKKEFLKYWSFYRDDNDDPIT